MRIGPLACDSQTVAEGLPRRFQAGLRDGNGARFSPSGDKR
ncbi:hypothetical protein BN975_03542 [Mycolicibacterium farcinogenes]|uniref:Uncharacterized protein n=2 Tax=Mycolicibacterium TaxID=1866885 RepID=A0A378W7V1_9MYCO|nr:hypothetical protein [Mycolicibacterium senegalense]CDP87722.1 hypothetical protein BN975_03542 [Mycolicibacterium farcinogenes]CQD02335.1 hypothetical protein BN970_00104 [Mycolicibacterium conceptionense]SUA29167.1 Uncharacterised protein [Mycolicibacterium senegalense]